MAEALFLGHSVSRAAFVRPRASEESAGRTVGAVHVRANTVAHSGELLSLAATHNVKIFSCPLARPLTNQRQLALSATSKDVPSGLSGAELASWVENTNKSASVVVYSKTYCPYCTQVKRLFKELNAPATVFELDRIDGGDDVQSALYDLTSQRTVPSVFIGGQHVGGCDATRALHSQGKLVPLLKAAGALPE